MDALLSFAETQFLHLWRTHVLPHVLLLLGLGLRRGLGIMLALFLSMGVVSVAIRVGAWLWDWIKFYWAWILYLGASFWLASYCGIFDAATQDQVLHLFTNKTAV
jgi:hypothetical protein